MKEFIGSAWCLLLVILTIGGCVKKHEPISLNYISLQRVEHPTQGGPEGLFHVYEVKFSTSADLKGVFDHPYDWLPNLFCVVSSPERQYRVADIPEGKVGLYAEGSLFNPNRESGGHRDFRVENGVYSAEIFFLSGNFSSAVNIDSALSELKDAEQEGGAMLCQVVISGGNLSVPGESSFIGTLKWLQTRPFYSETMTFPISELMK
ncbi:hypothetical protein [Leminorella richardii]|nr:hypothetical protein [Leminorella richardii]